MQRISEAAFARLVAGEVEAARAARLSHVRDVPTFQEHLIDVALRAERVARALQPVLPSHEAPDPIVAFIAGAWHDGGKIRHGDDYHEIPSALAVLDRGREWGLVSGSGDLAAVLARAARAILPGFALYEQWQPGTCRRGCPRDHFEPAYARLSAALTPSLDGDERDRALLFPSGVEALVVMYADMCNLAGDGHIASDFDAAFEHRWSDVERRAGIEDPALLSVMPHARPRIRDGCALVHEWLTTGFGASALARFRGRYCNLRRAEHSVPQRLPCGGKFSSAARLWIARTCRWRIACGSPKPNGARFYAASAM